MLAAFGAVQVDITTEVSRVLPAPKAYRVPQRGPVGDRSKGPPLELASGATRCSRFRAIGKDPALAQGWAIAAKRANGWPVGVDSRH